MTHPKKVALFVTCLVDTLYPDVGIATVNILERLQLTVDFPMAQTCCGQPAFNAGYWADAKRGAAHFLDVFMDADVIVTPSGSCASMIKHYYPTLFEGERLIQAQAIAKKTWELSEFLVDYLGITDLGLHRPPVTVAFHDACHGLRLGGLGEQARQLVRAIKGVRLTTLPKHDECCGFGGLFAVKMSNISGAMLQRKIEQIQSLDADYIITGDCGCLMQINGGLTRAGKPAKVIHLAEFIASSFV
ncbi:MAG: hypothetical protein CUN56_06285 [Phototrophicales bacterium]|nr:MAG: hypothetical protein CUN56_06285 [Phototrophicales bacterium]